jgi:O-antigen ligase/polysaccharide polymerase Wzy-like membrane protein
MAHEARPGRARLSAVRRPARVSATAGTRSLAGAALALPPLALLGLALFLAFRGGGIVPEQWAPVAVGTAVSLAVLGAVGSLPRVPRPAWPALGALTAFFAWSALSLTWSASPEATVETVARLSLAVLAAVVGASYAGRAGAARGFAVAVAAAGAVLAITVEAKILAGTTGVFSTARLAWPIDYANGDAALIWLAVPALLAGAAAERIRPLGRAAVAAFAALTVSEGLMTLSRGGAIALAATLIVCVALATERARLTLTLAGIVLPVAVLSTRLTGGKPGELASDAVARGRAAAIGAAAAGLIVGLIAYLERTVPRGFRQREGAVAVAVWACVLAIGASAFVVHYGRPDTWLSTRWREFRSPELTQPGNAARFGNATSNRYDYWRVAARTFEAHPLRGEGAGAFAVPWFRHRAIDENVTDAHSWEAAALAETGIVGLLLLAAALLLPFVQLVRARKELGSFAAVALGGTAAYFVLHGSLDWLFLIPAITVPAFIALGACAATGGAQETGLAPGRQRTAVAVGALVAATAAVPVYLSATLTARAENQAATSTQRALNSLSLATRVNPWAVQPLIVRSAILLDDRREPAAIRAAKDATRRAPNAWTAWAALADAERAGGHRVAAAAALRRARALNPRTVE